MGTLNWYCKAFKTYKFLYESTKQECYARKALDIGNEIRKFQEDKTRTLVNRILK